jgi:hypothetical protein
MTSYIKSYIKHCHACQVMKAGQRKPMGLLRPLQIPSRPWSSVSMDLITGLPPSSAGHDCIFVIVDRFTKMCHFEACSTAITAVQLAEMFCKMCWRHHGLPEEIVSDRDPRFTAKFLADLLEEYWYEPGHVFCVSPTNGWADRARKSHSVTDA